METNARYVLIGLFSLLVAGGALLFALWLGKASFDNNYDDYEVVFHEAVTGLSIGSPVQFSGIKVGDVQRLRLDPKDSSLVLVRIRVAANTPVRTNTTAKLTLAGITGSSFIQLSSGAPGSPKLVGADNKIPRIIAEQSSMSHLMNNGKDLLGNINDLLSNANRMLAPENAQRLSQTLENLQLATGAVAEQRNDLRQTITQLAQLSKQANQTLAQTSELLRTSNRLLDQHGSATLLSAQQTMAALQRSSSTIEQLLNSNQTAIGEGLQSFQELGPALRELRETLASLKGISQRIEANPAGYLLGREQPQEFQP
ncbi:MAG: MCE family protein [Pseudomonadaceae bacterium]|nr:MCE family protein [Pseudomonadaceae bacterium]